MCLAVVEPLDREDRPRRFERSKHVLVGDLATQHARTRVRTLHAFAFCPG